jgi:hypothetical protein
MRSTIAALTVLVSLILAPTSIARVEYEPQPPVCVVLRQVGNGCGLPTLAFQASVAPKRLPRHEAVPVTVHLAFKFGSVEGATIPSGLKELAFEFGRSFVVRTGSRQPCAQAKIDSERYGSVRARCRSAILGTGTAVLENQQGRLSALPLTLFATGGRGAGSSLVLRSPAGPLSPVPLVVPVDLRPAHSAYYSYEARVPVPRIEAGAVAVRSLKFRIGAGGGTALSSTCPTDGKIATNLTASLIDGERFEAEAIRSCSAGPARTPRPTGRATVGRKAMLSAPNIRSPWLKVGLKPKDVSRSRPTPGALVVETKIDTLDGDQLPGLTGASLNFDRNVAFDLKGLPVCGGLQLQDGIDHLEFCGPAIVGTGKVEVELEFPENVPLRFASDLTIYSGGERDGVAKLYAIFPVSTPSQGRVISTIEIHRVSKGPLGSVAILTVPQMDGGFGHLVRFRAKIARNFLYRGRSSSVVSLRCPGRTISAFGTGSLSDGEALEEEVVQPCVGE